MVPSLLEQDVCGAGALASARPFQPRLPDPGYPMLPAPEHLSTARLAGTRVRRADLLDFQAYHGDPRVMECLHPGRAAWDPKELEALLDAHIRHWEEHGFGTWAFRDRRDGRFAGRAGFRYYEMGSGPEIELYYGVTSDLWGQGYATEMTREIIRVAREEMGVRELVAFTLPANEASRRVLAKCGFSVGGDIVHAGLDHLLLRRTLASGPERAVRSAVSPGSDRATGQDDHFGHHVRSDSRV